MAKSLISLFFILICAAVLDAHDMFLKLTSFFLAPNANATIVLYNGTFEKSENFITRNRMSDVSIAGPGSERVHPDTSRWRNAGATTMLDFKTGNAGTYVIGVSTKAKIIALAAKDFNDYLTHDGVLDVLEARKKNKEVEKGARELYSKHVKAVVQVGEKRSDGYKANLGYPIEIVPQQNPYELKAGDVLSVQVLRDGKPVASRFVYASYAGYHSHDDQGGQVAAVKTRTAAAGMAKINLEKSGQWYIRLIHMVASGRKDVDFESNWATLTFEVN